MNYPQEKYNEVRAATGINMLSSFIDRILSTFATVPQVTLEEAVQIRSEYYRRVGPEGIKTAQEIMQQVVNSVLAKQGPVIAATPADGMVSLDDVDNAIRDNYLAHRMPTNKSFRDEVRARLTKNKKPEYSEAVTYTPEIFSQERKLVCSICGACVSDRGRHTAWHGTQQG